MLCKTLCNCKRKRSCHARKIRTRSTTSNCTIFFYVLSLDTVKYTQTQNLSILGIGPYLNRTNIKSTQEDRLLRQNDKKCCDGIGFQMRLEILSQLFMELCNELQEHIELNKDKLRMVHSDNIFVYLFSRLFLQWLNNSMERDDINRCEEENWISSNIFQIKN